MINLLLSGEVAEWTKALAWRASGQKCPVGSNPTLSAILKVPGCARWGVSGALNLQPAIAGLNPFLEVKLVQAILYKTAMKTGPYTAETYEPRQVRKEAAVSSHLRVM